MIIKNMVYLKKNIDGTECGGQLSETINKKDQ